MRVMKQIQRDEGAGAVRTPSPLAVRPPSARRAAIAFWAVSALFCLQMCFTAYAQLRLPQVAQAFAHLGFPDYFRVELSCAKLLGVALLLAPVPARVKEWAYAGFAIDLGSAFIAHVTVGDGPAAWGWAVGTGVLLTVSYLSWRNLSARVARPGPEAATREGSWQGVTTR